MGGGKGRKGNLQNGRNYVVTPEHKHSLIIHHAKHLLCVLSLANSRLLPHPSALTGALGLQQEEAHSKQVFKMSRLVGSEYRQSVQGSGERVVLFPALLHSPSLLH